MTEAGKKRYAKYEKKISRLEDDKKDLEKKLEKRAKKSEVKAAELLNDAARLRAKKYGWFSNEKKAAKYEYEAEKAEAKAQKIIAKTELTKAEIAKVDALISKYDRKMSELNPEHVSSGKAYIEKHYAMQRR